MSYVLAWIGVAALLALWSLSVWALHAAAAWAVSNAGSLTGAASGIGALPVPEWLAPWMAPDIVTAWRDWIVSLGPFVDRLLQALPGLAGGVTLAAWLLWGLGSVALLGAGVALHALIAMWRRRGRASGSANGRTAAA